MLSQQYVISTEAKKRATDYLKRFIANRGIVHERGNSNIELTKNCLDEFSLSYSEFSKNGYKSVMTPKSSIILNSHVDVVSGKTEEFKPKIVSDKMYGRGSADALGCAVSQIICAQELKRMNKHPTLMIVSDEEAGGLNGTRYILENHFDEKELEKTKYAIVGEPTECFGFSIREKGILRLRLEVFGKRSHPEKENIDNAINTASEIIREVRYSKILKRKDEYYKKLLHINPIDIKGGIASNIIPDKVSIEYDIRFAYGITIEEIMNIFESLKKRYNFEISIIKSRNASYADTDNRYFSVLNEIAGNPEKIITNGASDYSYFFENNIAGVVYGVKGAGWHKEGEYVELDSMYKYIENIINFVLEVS